MQLSISSKKFLPATLNRVQWLIVGGIFFYNRVEIIVTVIAVAMLLMYKRHFYRSKIFKYLFLAYLLSFITATICHYSYGKMIQQMFLVAVIYLLNEQFFIANFQYLGEVFRKFIKFSFWVSCLGILQQIVWLLLHYDLSTILDLQWITGFPGMFVQEGPFIRVRSVSLEGGELGEKLIPSLVYLFYYKDCYGILKRKWHKWIVLVCSLFTISPLAYITILIIAYLRITKVVPKLKPVFYACGIGILLMGIWSAQKSDLSSHSDISGVDGIVVRIRDTSQMLENINTRDAAFSANVSTGVLMSNLYSAINAPSRLLGTGIGTNGQNYERSYGFYRSFENSITDLNTDDAYSILIRVFSEFGIVGLILLGLFLYKHFRKNNVINVCMFFFVFPYLFRGGAYVGWGITFAFFMFYYSSKLYKSK